MPGLRIQNGGTTLKFMSIFGDWAWVRVKEDFLFLLHKLLFISILKVKLYPHITCAH